MIRKNNCIFLLTLLACLFPILVFANLEDITWKGTYYHSMPNKEGISQKYCDEHTPGTFVHDVKDPMHRVYTTDHGVQLSRATLHIQEIHGIYLISGDLYASKKNDKENWTDHLYFYFSKLTEAGTTRGVWSTENCKGLWIADAIKKHQ